MHLLSLNAFLGLLTIVGIGLLAGYRWQQAVRARRIKAWIGEYLVNHYGTLPSPLSIHFVDDTPRPILVGFVGADRCTRHRLRFVCPGGSSTLALVSHVTH